MDETLNLYNSIPTKKRTTRKRLRPCTTTHTHISTHQFRTFCEPGQNGPVPPDPTPPFRDNIAAFLGTYCSELAAVNFTAKGTRIWCTLLAVSDDDDGGGGGVEVPLFVIEEEEEEAPNPVCDHCLSTDWSNDFVSEKKYHIIIPMDDDWKTPPDDSILEDTSHLLHGLIHCNGFGHLLCINGLKGGSKHFRGRDIMDLWDRICTTLHTRKITVEDFSNKWSMELRLLHGVAYGHSWFGRWGYRFCHGSFGLKEETYKRALEILSSVQLEKIVLDLSDMEECEELKKIIDCYKHRSESSLVTIRDLLNFMLTVKAVSPVQRKPQLPNATRECYRDKPKLLVSVIRRMNDRYTARKLKTAADAVVHILRENKRNGFINGEMSRQDLRDAVLLHGKISGLPTRDSGLVDNVMKNIDNVVIGNHIVYRTLHTLPIRVIKFTVHDLEPDKQSLPYRLPRSAPVPDVYSDVLYLYKNVLLEYPKSKLVELAAQVVLNNKHFVKEYQPAADIDDEQDLMTLACQADTASPADPGS